MLPTFPYGALTERQCSPHRAMIFEIICGIVDNHGVSDERVNNHSGVFSGKDHLRPSTVTMPLWLYHVRSLYLRAMGGATRQAPVPR
jgi:hypothetical protein